MNVGLECITLHFFQFRFVKPNLLLKTVAQFDVVFLLFALGLEFSTTKVDLIHISPSKYVNEVAHTNFPH